MESAIRLTRIRFTLQLSAIERPILSSATSLALHPLVLPCESTQNHIVPRSLC